MRFWHIPPGPDFCGGKGGNLELIKGERSNEKGLLDVFMYIKEGVRNWDRGRKQKNVFSGERTRDSVAEMLF